MDRSGQGQKEGLNTSTQKLEPVGPTDPRTLLRFTSDANTIWSLLCCVRCNKLVNPAEYYICEGEGHHMCSECAKTSPIDFLDPPSSSSSKLKGVVKPEDLGSRDLVPVKKCCATDQLVQGPSRMMGVLLNKSKWNCKYMSFGCNEKPLRKDWESHIRSCRFGIIFMCKLPNCCTLLKSKAEAVSHYTKLHKLRIYRGGIEDITVSFQGLREGTVVELILWNNKYYLFGAEINGNALKAWVWDMQTMDYANVNAVGKAAYKFTFVRVVVADDNPDKGKLQDVFSRKCVPYDYDPDDIIDSQSFFISVPLQQFLKLYVRLRALPSRASFWSFKVEMNMAEK